MRNIVIGQLSIQNDDMSTKTHYHAFHASTNCQVRQIDYRRWLAESVRWAVAAKSIALAA